MRTLVRGVAGLFGEPVGGPRVDALEFARRHDREEVAVPLGIERLHGRDAGGVVASGVDDPLLTCGALLGREPATLGDQVRGDLGCRAFQGGHGRVVRQPARAEEQHPLVQVGGRRADDRPEQTRTPCRAERLGDAVDEHRDDRDAVDATEQHLQRLREAVVDVHPLRQRHVDLGVQYRLGECPRRVVIDRQRPGRGVVVTDRLGGRADAEARHHVVEEPVVVVRPEHHDQLRVELGDERPRTRQRLVDALARFRRGFGEPHQGRMGHRDQCGRHRIEPLPAFVPGTPPRATGMLAFHWTLAGSRERFKGSEETSPKPLAMVVATRSCPTEVVGA